MGRRLSLSRRYQQQRGKNTQRLACSAPDHRNSSSGLEKGLILEAKAAAVNDTELDCFSVCPKAVVSPESRMHNLELCNQ
jgi:hypothetical protein